MSKKAKDKKSFGFTIASWIISVFLLVVGLALLPSVASFVLMFAGVLCIPVKPIKAIWDKVPMKKIIKPVLITVLFLVGVITSPPKEKDPDALITNTPIATESTIAGSNDSSGSIVLTRYIQNSRK